MSGHGHAHGPASAQHRGRMTAVLVLTCSIMVAEVVGALVSGSLALLADAGHMLTDAAGIAVALGASWLAGRPATDRRTFGWQRVEILAAMINGLLLAVIGVTVIVEGVQRTVAGSSEVETGVMIVVAVVGLLANLVGLAVLRRGQEESLNVRGAYLEVLGDALGSVAVIVAGVVIAATGFVRADGIASVVIGLLILPRAVSLLREVAQVLLEATPAEIDLERVREHIMAVHGVVAVHDLHAWTITSGVPVLSAHVVVDDGTLAQSGTSGVLDRLHGCLAGHFDVEHCTFQVEGSSVPVGEHAVHA